MGSKHYSQISIRIAPAARQLADGSLSPGDLLAGEEAAPGEGLCILVADDDQGCRQGIVSLLAEDGHNIFTAARGEEAVELARHLRSVNRRLDLSFLDYDMPDLTGIETFQRMILELPDLAVVFISGDASNSLEGEVRLVGGRGLLRKPLGVASLRRAVKEAPAGRDFLVG